MLCKQSEYAGYRSELPCQKALRGAAHVNENVVQNFPQSYMYCSYSDLVKFFDYPNQVLSMTFKMRKKVVK